MYNKLKIWFIIVLLCTAVFAQVEQLPLDLQQRQIKRMASEFERNGQTEQAADIYYLITLENPLDISAYAGAKRTLLKLQQFDRFQQLILDIQKSRRDIRYEVDLAEIEYLKGNTRSAKKRWDEVVENNAMRHNSYALVGQVLTKHGLIDDAVSCYLEGRKKLKDNRLFIFELSALYVHRGEYDKATQEYIAYLETNPKQLHFIDTRFANLEKEENSKKTIIKSLKRAQEELPQLSLELHQILGNIYTRNQDYNNAIEQFIIMEDTLLARKDSRVGLYLYQFATLAAKENAIDVSELAFETILSKYPSSAYSNRARLGFAFILEQKGMFSEAIQSYEQFIKEYPKSAEAQDALQKIGDIYFFRLKETNQAKLAYDRLVKKYPRSPKTIQTYFMLGECEILNNNLDNAKGFFKHIILESKNKKDINYKKALYAMADLHLKSGEIKQSQTLLQEYFSNKINGNKPDIFENDALELNMLLNENSMDSTGLLVYGHAALLYQQNKIHQSDSVLTGYLASTPETPLKEVINMFRSQLYVDQQDYDKAVALLQEMYKNEENLQRDKVLINMADIYQSNLDQSEKAKEMYESLLVNFPSSIYIEEARKKIRTLQ